MKPHLCWIWALLCAMAVAPMLRGGVETTTYPPYPGTAASSYVPPRYPDSAAVALSSSNSLVVALNGQAEMLEELMRQHQRRAADLAQKNQAERARWETELVNELKERSARAQQSLAEVSSPGGASPKPGGTAADAELEFLSALEARRAQVQQELSAAMADGHVLSMQIATNKAPESIGMISLALGDNQRLVNELQKQQLDLELRKLEFRALRQAMQK